MAILYLGLIGGSYFHNQFVLNKTFRGPSSESGHVIWHNLITALHNNPERTKRYCIPPTMPTYDDQVGYLLLDREIARLNKNRGTYISNNNDWVYRTTASDLNFRWLAYDAVLRNVFLRTIATDPLYAIRSFLIEQPKSVIKIFVSRNFPWGKSLNVPIILALILGAIVSSKCFQNTTGFLWFSVAVMWLAAIPPLLIAAVIELRIADIWFAIMLTAAMCLSLLCRPYSKICTKLKKYSTPDWIVMKRFSNSTR